jgi:hypothetical protein
MNEQDFISEVERLSKENKGLRKVFFLKHIDYHPDSIIYLEVANYDAAKEVFKKIYGSNYNEEHFERQEGFVNNKPVFIHFLISKKKND